MLHTIFPKQIASLVFLKEISSVKFCAKEMKTFTAYI